MNKHIAHRLVIDIKDNRSNNGMSPGHCTEQCPKCQTNDRPSAILHYCVRLHVPNWCLRYIAPQGFM